jgi:hypothetical protein
MPDAALQCYRLRTAIYVAASAAVIGHYAALQAAGSSSSSGSGGSSNVVGGSAVVTPWLVAAAAGVRVAGKVLSNECHVIGVILPNEGADVATEAVHQQQQQQQVSAMQSSWLSAADAAAALQAAAASENLQRGTGHGVVTVAPLLRQLQAVVLWMGHQLSSTQLKGDKPLALAENTTCLAAV